MTGLLAGLVALALVLLLARIVVAMSPGTLLQTMRVSAGALLLALAGLLLYVRKFGWALFVGGNAFSLLRSRRARSQRQFRRAAPKMSREEAFRVLDLEPNASAKEIRSAHRRLISKLHPDKGGGDYLASKINEARDTLLGE
ncbi:MAG: DnaJ domain-containing protein [Hyphomicrobiales bacterium]|nr:DnaJ domain-containing protein [Hyphomicrobiales bacterium]MCY4033770.1 DnaJ domain-containing protein [Hyphomicrobiales bacterium]MCY4039405.1 DnaJ domain-containing protein [Hyphomicrobiales bacterium]